MTMVSMPERPDGPAMSSDQIADALERAIVEHRLPPGAKLPEDEIGELYGAGRTVVRGALQRLAHGGLVTLRRHRGASVAQPDLREAREVFEARALLEPRTARSAALRATLAQVKLLRGAYRRGARGLGGGRRGPRGLRCPGGFTSPSPRSPIRRRSPPSSRRWWRGRRW